MRPWRRSSSIAPIVGNQFEPDIRPLREEDEVADQEAKRQRFTFKVLRPAGQGHVEYSGHCAGVEMARNGAAVIRAEGGKRFYLAAGTWNEVITETRRA